MTCVLHAARISDVESIMHGDTIKNDGKCYKLGNEMRIMSQTWEKDVIFLCV